MFHEISVNIIRKKSVNVIGLYEDGTASFLTFGRQRTCPFLLSLFHTFLTVSPKCGQHSRLSYIQLFLIKNLQGILGSLGGLEGVEVPRITYSPHSRYF